MKKLLVLAVAATTFLSIGIRAQDAKGVIDAAAKAMGTATLQAVQYSATGSTYGFGQAIGPGQPWPRFTITKYVAAINHHHA
jgi:hypothetical protein